MADEEPLYDVTVNIHKDKQNGYGIYFTQRNGTIVVTKLDKGSEAERAGVPGARHPCQRQGPRQHRAC